VSQFDGCTAAFVDSVTEAGYRWINDLTLLTNTRVVRVRVVNGRAAGLDCAGPDGAVDLTADRIVLCAGAIASAQLLMLSGVGPEGALRSAGVPVHVDLPVGVASVDHPEWVVPVNWSATRSATAGSGAGNR
jgi:choline dehydrogenase